MNIKKAFFTTNWFIISYWRMVIFNLYNKIYKPNTTKEGYLYIATNSDLSDVENLVETII